MNGCIEENYSLKRGNQAFAIGISTSEDEKSNRCIERIKTLKKTFIAKISAVILSMFLLVILFLGDYYESVYSSCKANTVTIAKNINTVIANSDISVNSELKGYIIDDKLCITYVDGQKCNIELNSIANFSDIKYWIAKLEGQKVTRIWTADKEILEESKLKEYKYGDQKNIFTLLSNNYIGYYEV